MDLRQLKRRGSELASEAAGWKPASTEALAESLCHYWLTEMKDHIDDIDITDEDAVQALGEGYLHGG